MQDRGSATLFCCAFKARDIPDAGPPARRTPPVMPRDEGRRVQESGAPEAIQALFGRHRGLAAKIARRYAAHGLPPATMTAEAEQALMHAVLTFDPAQDTPLGTYAMWWIKVALNACVLKAGAQAMTGSAEWPKRLRFSLGRLEAKLNAYQDTEMRNVPSNNGDGDART